MAPAQVLPCAQLQAELNDIVPSQAIELKSLLSKKHQ
jgi:hypothetical protein